jgi:DNA-binding protein H-NS
MRVDLAKDLDKYSTGDLSATVEAVREWLTRAAKHVDVLKRREKEEGIKKALQAAGYSLADALEIAGKAKAKPKVARNRKAPPIFYRDPETGNVWKRAGRKPAWVVEAEKNGTLEQLKVNPTDVE